MKFISQRCVNVNRGESNEKKPKRAKLEEFVLNLKEKGQRFAVYTVITSRLSRATVKV